jgi:O-antigen ligase
VGERIDLTFCLSYDFFIYFSRNVFMEIMIYGSLIILAAGLLTSMSLLALSHILLIIPIFYFLPKTNFKGWSKSTWALVAMTVAIILSVFLNQDIAVNGYKPLSKSKYFFFAFLSIAPFSYFFKNSLDEKKIKILLRLILVASVVAGFFGILGKITGYNFLSFKHVNKDRNAGLFGMVLNYAHNLSYFQILLFGLVLYKEEVETFIKPKILNYVFAFNIVSLYLTYTRGAWLALIIGVPFYFFKEHKKNFIIVLITLLLTGGALYVLSGKSVKRKGSDAERISQWQSAFMAFKERPLFGYGYLNFEPHSVELKKRYDIGAQHFGGHAHNIFLEMLATTGLFGFIPFLLWLSFWFYEMYKRNDLVAKWTLPFIITFMVGGMTQSTISLGINLFFILAIYSISQVNDNVLKK